MPNPDPPRGPLAPPLLRRVFSLTGVVSLGIFLLLHLALNARALRGEEAFSRASDGLQSLPPVALLEWLLVLGPLLLHASIGLWLVFRRTPLAERSPYAPPMHIAVRVTGVAAVAFLAMHLLELRFRAAGARLSGGELATVLTEDLSSVWHGVPWRGAAYLVGTACVVFHFSAGLWGFALKTRVRSWKRARRWTGWGVAALGLLVWALFANVVVFRATGTRLFGGTAEEPEESGAPCPANE